MFSEREPKKRTIAGEIPMMNRAVGLVFDLPAVLQRPPPIVLPPFNIRVSTPRQIQQSLTELEGCGTVSDPTGI